MKQGHFRMRCLAIGLVIFTITTNPPVTYCETTTIISEATYIMGDGETPAFAEAMALQRAKQRSLEEAGTYVESYTKTLNQDLTKEEIQTLAGGVLHVEIIENNRTLVQDGLRIYLRIRSTVTTDNIEELALRIRGKNVAEEYKALQVKYEALLQEVAELKQAIAKSPSSAEREIAINRIREQERSFADLKKTETALFTKLTHGEALIAEARTVLRLSDSITNALLKSGIALDVADLKPTLVRGSPGLIELHIDVWYQVNDNLLRVIQQAAAERQAIIDDVLIYRGDIHAPTYDRISLLKAKLVKFPDKREIREELLFLEENLRGLSVLVEFLSGKKSIGFCRFPYITVPLLPGIRLKERAFPEGSYVNPGLTKVVTSSPKYFDSEAQYQEFSRLDGLVTEYWRTAIEKWHEAQTKWEQGNEKMNQPGPSGHSPNALMQELERREALAQLSPSALDQLNEFRTAFAEPKAPTLDEFPEEIQVAAKKVDSLTAQARKRWLDSHPSLIRVEEHPLESGISSASLLIVNQKYVLPPQKLVMSEQSLKQLTQTTARLVRPSENLSWHQPLRSNCEGIVYRNGKRLHIVKPGETPESISRRYGIKVEELRQWNKLSTWDIFIDEGRELIVGDE